MEHETFQQEVVAISADPVRDALFVLIKFIKLMFKELFDFILNMTT